jgi:hypothetical protein
VDALAAILLVGLALALRAVHLRWGFPEIYEEATPVREAVGFWGQPGRGLDLNPHFFKYPSFSLYLNFIVQSIGYLWLSISGSVQSLSDFRQLLSQDLPRAVLAGRWISAVLGALTVIPTMALGKALGGRWVAIGAGALLAVAPLAVRESRLASPDVLLLLCSTACLAAATRWATGGARSQAVAAGVWFGLAVAAKYPGALLAVALVTAHAVVRRREGAGPLGLLLSSRLVQVFGAALAAFAVASPYALLDFRRAAEDIAFERRHMVLGHLGREDSRAWGYYLLHALPAGLTLGVVLAALVGAGWLLADRRRRAAALPGVGFVLVSLAVLGSWRMAAPRYVLPLASVAAAWAAGAAAGMPILAGARGRVQAAAVVVLFAALFVPSFLESAREVRGGGRTDSRAAAAAWIEANVSEGSAILVERYGPEPDPVRHMVAYLPFHGVTPHVYDAAYVSALYSGFDVVVFSSGVSARYLADFREYPFQASFYTAMEAGFKEVATFGPGLQNGPEIRILRRRGEARFPNLDSLPANFFSAQRGNGPLAEYLSGLGTVLVRRGDEASGFRLLEESVTMDPRSAKAWGNLGSMHLRSGQLEEALTAFRRAREVAPGDVGVIYNLGVLYDRMGEPRQASEAFQEVVGRDPGFEAAYLPLARALVEDDHFQEARLVLRGFQERFPRSPKRQEAEAALRELLFMGSGHP